MATREDGKRAGCLCLICLVFRCCLAWLASSSDLSVACRSLFVVSLFVYASVVCLVVTCGVAGELAR